LPCPDFLPVDRQVTEWLTQSFLGALILFPSQSARFTFLASFNIQTNAFVKRQSFNEIYVKRIMLPEAFFSSFYQANLSEISQMLRYLGLGQVKGLKKPANTLFPAGQQPKQLQPGPMA